MAEKEKRRATTFVTSRGAIINVAAPSVYIAPGVTPVDVTSPAELREEFDVHSAFTFEKFLNQGLDAHFDARRYNPDFTESPVKASDYWKQISGAVQSDGEFRCPVTARATAAYSKNVFNLLAARTKIPTMIAGQACYIGFEDGSSTGTGICSFVFNLAYGLQAGIGGQFFGVGYVITGALPVDSETVVHNYGVAILRQWVEFYVDGIPVAFGINSPNLAFPDITYPPYGIFRTNILSGLFSTKQLGFVEVIGGGVGALNLPLAPSRFRLSHISEHPPRVFRLYEAGTSNLFAGKAVAAGTLTSHPVPVFGYSDKMLYFRASQAGTLSIEVLTQAGNWRTYDSDTVSANELWWYKMTGDAVLARLAYTPTTYPATVSDGEMILNE